MTLLLVLSLKFESRERCTCCRTVKILFTAVHLRRTGPGGGRGGGLRKYSAFTVNQLYLYTCVVCVCDPRDRIEKLLELSYNVSRAVNDTPPRTGCRHGCRLKTKTNMKTKCSESDPAPETVQTSIATVLACQCLLSQCRCPWSSASELCHT